MKVLDREGLHERVEGYLLAIALKADEEFKKHYSSLEAPKFSMDIGGRYIKIVRHDAKNGSRSVHSFIDRSNGDILKAASWRGPAKHPRGNVFEADYGMKSSGANWISVRYL